MGRGRCRLARRALLHQGHAGGRLAPNSAEWYLLRLACETAGLVWVPVPASQGVREMAVILERTRAQLMITSTRHRGRDYVKDADLACRKAGIDLMRVAVPENAPLQLSGPFF